MKHIRLVLVACALGLLALTTGCTTTPKEEEKKEAEAPKLVIPTGTAATVDFIMQLSKLERENELLRTAGLLKLAEDSDSLFAKGMIAGMIAGTSGGSAPKSSASTELMRTVVDIKKLDMQEAESKREHEGRYGLGARTLQWAGVAVDYLGLRFGYRTRMRQIDSDDNRYKLTLDSMTSARRDGYAFGTSVFNAYDNRVGEYMSRTPQTTATTETAP